jgi:hypothetical protein
MITVEENVLDDFRNIIVNEGRRDLFENKFAVINRDQVDCLADSLAEGIKLGNKKFGFGNFICKRLFPKI